MSKKNIEVMSWLRSDTGRLLNSCFFKRGKKLEYVRPGSTFRRVKGDGMIETAKILTVGTDSFGIPHVKFEVSFTKPNRQKFDGGARMLALKSFGEQYGERSLTS